MTRDPQTTDDLVPPACRATIELLQGVLDGELPTAVLEADPHPLECAECRGRVAAGRLLVAALASPSAAPAVPSGLADRIIGAVRDDRRARSRRRAFALAGGLAAAVAVAAFWLRGPTVERPDVASREPAAPAPDVAPEPRPVRIGEELSKAGLALLDAPKSITETTAAAPRVIAKVTDALTRTAPPVEVESPRAALAEIPDLALAGLEPVTGTAQRAFTRLLNDVGSVQFGMKPKS